MRLIMTTSRGMFLLEALLALIVFAFGMLGLLALLVNALRESGSAHWRSEAFDVASATLSGMWAQDPASLALRYDAAADGPGYRALLAAAMRLPGVTARINAPRVTIDDSESAGKRISVTVYWQTPAERIAHQASVAGTLPSH
jgi:type IV pilus assembly protein PilV